MFLSLVFLLAMATVRIYAMYENPWTLKADQLQGCYDFIIVGAGSAGCRLAEKLSSHQDAEVLLIEAGGSPPDFTAIPLMTKLSVEADLVWRYRIEPMQNAFKDKPNRAQTLIAGRVLGGGSTINLMNYERGDRQDYDAWETEFGATGWNAQSMFDYFISDENNSDNSISEKFHGRRGSLRVSSSYDTNILKGFFDAAQEKGYKVRDTGDGSTEGVYRMQATIDENGRRSSSYTAFIESHLGRRRNLHVITKALASRILFSRDERNGTTTANGVEFIHDNRSRKVCARKEVILSAGAIETPRLLMLSGIGPKEHLQKMKIKVLADLPVGRNLQNHVAVRGIDAVINSTSNYEIPNVNDFRSLLEWYKFGRGPFTSPSGTHLGVGFFKMNQTDTIPDIEIMLRGSSEDPLCEPSPKQKEGKFSLLTILMRPKSRGSVELQSREPFSAPLIKMNYLDHPDDRELLAQGAKFAYDLLELKSFNAIGVRPKSTIVEQCSDKGFNTIDYWKCVVTVNTVSMGHPAGSCRMGSASRSDTVVDHNLRVKLVKNLRIADCSIMPSLNTGHTNAPAIAIGARAGDLILKDHNYTLLPLSQ